MGEVVEASNNKPFDEKQEKVHSLGEEKTGEDPGKLRESIEGFSTFPSVNEFKYGETPAKPDTTTEKTLTSSLNHVPYASSAQPPDSSQSQVRFICGIENPTFLYSEITKTRPQFLDLAISKNAFGEYPPSENLLRPCVKGREETLDPKKSLNSFEYLASHSKVLKNVLNQAECNFYQSVGFKNVSKSFVSEIGQSKDNKIALNLYVDYVHQSPIVNKVLYSSVRDADKSQNIKKVINSAYRCCQDGPQGFKNILNASVNVFGRSEKIINRKGDDQNLNSTKALTASEIHPVESEDIKIVLNSSEDDSGKSEDIKNVLTSSVYDADQSQDNKNILTPSTGQSSKDFNNALYSSVYFLYQSKVVKNELDLPVDDAFQTKDINSSENYPDESGEVKKFRVNDANLCQDSSIESSNQSRSCYETLKTSVKLGKNLSEDVIETTFLHSDQSLLRKSKPSSRNRPKIFSCELCEYRCSRLYRLREHEIVKHTRKFPFKCNICEYGSLYRKDLKRHDLAKHSAFKPFSCTHCPYSSVYQSDVQRHVMFKHTLEKPFSCNQCFYKTPHSGHLKRHKKLMHSFANVSRHFPPDASFMLLDKGDKPFRCALCTFSSTVKKGLKIHISSKHRRNTFHVCKICDFNTWNTKKFKKHAAAHDTPPLNQQASKSSVIKHYECAHCQGKLRGKASLKFHINMKHFGKNVKFCPNCDFKTLKTEKIEKHINENHSELKYNLEQSSP